MTTNNETAVNQPIETRNNAGTVVIRAWEPDGGFDAGTYRQAHAVSKTAGVVLPVMLMPDAHVGNGSCIGSVIAGGSGGSQKSFWRSRRHD